jgi:hypothetical protein
MVVPPQGLRPWTNAEIHDTVAAIASQRIYAPARRSLLGRFLTYLLERLGDLLELIRGSPDARVLLIAAMVLIALVSVARIVTSRRADAERGRVRSLRKPGDARADAWAAAEAFAGAGDFTSACHALYAAVVDELAFRGAVRRHASKTSGDYVRDLRARGVPTAREFRDFALDFDRVIYGHGVAAADDYARLSRLAERAARTAAAA